MNTEAGEKDSLVYRPYTTNDINFIRSSWANSFYKGCDVHKILTANEFHKFHRPTIDRFFERPTATLIVVHEESEPDLILAWIAVEILISHLIIHYIYTRHSFKNISLTTDLIKRVNVKNKPIVFTHLTDKARSIIRNNHIKYRNYSYIPHLL